MNNTKNNTTEIAHENKKITDDLLDELGYKKENNSDFFKAELDAKGWTLRNDGGGNYVIEPRFKPTARIIVNDIVTLTDAYRLITNK